MTSLKNLEVSSDDILALRTSLKRVHALTELLQQENARCNAMVEALFSRVSEPVFLVGGIPASKSSAGFMDHQAMLGHVQTAAVGEAAGNDQSLPQMLGKNGVLARHLAPSVMICGKGSLTPSRVLPQFDEDLITATVERLLQWPMGFYRNATTKELQLLLRFNEGEYIYRIDKLPGEFPQVKVFALDTAAGEEKIGANYRDFSFPFLTQAHSSSLIMELLGRFCAGAEQVLTELTISSQAPAATN